MANDSNFIQPSTHFEKNAAISPQTACQSPHRPTQLILDSSSKKVLQAHLHLRVLQGIRTPFIPDIPLVIIQIWLLWISSISVEEAIQVALTKVVLQSLSISHITQASTDQTSPQTLSPVSPASHYDIMEADSQNVSVPCNTTHISVLKNHLYYSSMKEIRNCQCHPAKSKR